MDVSSSSFPWYERNLNTGGNNYDEAKGFPTEIDYDGEAQIADDEIFYRVSDVHRVDVATSLRSWRYQPLFANRTAVPFCYEGRFEFRSE